MVKGIEMLKSFWWIKWGKPCLEVQFKNIKVKGVSTLWRIKNEPMNLTDGCVSVFCGERLFYQAYYGKGRPFYIGEVPEEIHSELVFLWLNGELSMPRYNIQTPDLDYYEDQYPMTTTERLLFMFFLFLQM